MDPFTLVGVFVFLKGWGARAKKREAHERFVAAEARMRLAAHAAQAQGLATSEAAAALARDRAAVTLWLRPLVEDAFEELGAASALYGGVDTVFARTREQMQRLLQKVLAAFPPFQFRGDAALLALSSSALLLKGVDYLDSVDVIHAPLLHESLQEVVAGLPVSGADAFAHSVDALGAVDVADVLSDGLLVLGLIRLAMNLRRANQLDADAGAADSEAALLEAKRGELKQMQGSIFEVASRQDEASYSVYRSVLVVKAVTRRSGVLAPAARDRMIRSLRLRCSAWWTVLQSEPKPA